MHDMQDIVLASWWFLPPCIRHIQNCMMILSFRICRCNVVEKDFWTFLVSFSELYLVWVIHPWPHLKSVRSITFRVFVYICTRIEKWSLKLKKYTFRITMGNNFSLLNSNPFDFYFCINFFHLFIWLLLK